jgi:hypothetical protein
LTSWTFSPLTQTRTPSSLPTPRVTASSVSERRNAFYAIPYTSCQENELPLGKEAVCLAVGSQVGSNFSSQNWRASSISSGVGSRPVSLRNISRMLSQPVGHSACERRRVEQNIR